MSFRLRLTLVAATAVALAVALASASRDRSAVSSSLLREYAALAASVRLAEPVWKCELGGDAFFRERDCHCIPIGAPDEQVEVFRVAAYPGVTHKREGAADEEVDAFLLKHVDDAFVELRSVPAGDLNSR